jgi:hypothetical protein
MKLLAKISSADLFLRMLNELGVAFYRKLEGDIVEAVYFSSNRTIYFRGELTAGQMEALKAQAYQANSIGLDPRRELLEVSQFDDA